MRGLFQAVMVSIGLSWAEPTRVKPWLGLKIVSSFVVFSDGRARSRAELGRSTPEAQGWQTPPRRTLTGGANLACGGPSGRGPGGCDGSWMGLVMWLMSWSAMGSAWTSLQCDTNLTCQSRGRAQFLLDLVGGWRDLGGTRTGCVTATQRRLTSSHLCGDFAPQPVAFVGMRRETC